MSANAVISILRYLRRFIKWCFRYPVNIEYCRQYETKDGYVFEVNANSESKRVVSIPKKAITLRIRCNRKLARRSKKGALLYGETTSVFESRVLLKAFIEGTSFGNVGDSILCQEHRTPVFLLLSVHGPGSKDPSLRLQLGKVYESVELKIRKRLLRLTYLEIPLRQIAIIGDKRTKIVDN